MRIEMKGREAVIADHIVDVLRPFDSILTSIELFHQIDHRTGLAGAPFSLCHAELKRVAAGLVALGVLVLVSRSRGVSYCLATTVADVLGPLREARWHGDTLCVKPR